MRTGVLVTLPPQYWAQFGVLLTLQVKLTGMPDVQAGTATCYELEGPANRIPVEVRFSKPVQTGPGAHPPSCTMGTGSLSRDKVAGA